MNPILKILFILSKKTFREFRVFRGQKEVEVIGKPAARRAGINEEVTFFSQRHREHRGVHLFVFFAYFGC